MSGDGDFDLTTARRPLRELVVTVFPSFSSSVGPWDRGTVGLQSS
jgi:hypothetical protein